jgi:2-hydroxychromene-2-carboxylate isomerase
MEVEVYYDVSSPYTYLAFTRLFDVIERYDAKLTLLPVYLGGLFKALGRTLPHPSKLTYMQKDLNDWASFLGVPLKFPSVFPLNSIQVQRGAVWMKDRGLEEAYVKRVFPAYWVEDRDLSKDEELLDIVNSLGVDSQDFLQGVRSEEVKQKLKEITEVALSRGVFGVPTFFVSGEMFWGNDRLLFVEKKLEGSKRS